MNTVITCSDQCSEVQLCDKVERGPGLHLNEDDEYSDEYIYEYIDEYSD